jgi:hypothetical protein
MAQQQRQFIRHPLTIPIEARRVGTQAEAEALQAHAIGVGGLAFHCTGRLEPGAVVHVRISYVDPAFETDARVVWCRAAGNDSELGVEFLNADDAYKARMVEQVCHIESYRQRVLATEGRRLTTQEAAIEWIRDFAVGFPDPGTQN